MSVNSFNTQTISPPLTSFVIFTLFTGTSLAVTNMHLTRPLPLLNMFIVPNNSVSYIICISIIPAHHTINHLVMNIIHAEEIMHVDLSWNKHSAKRHNSHLLPKSIRALLIRMPGCDEKTSLMNLLLKPGRLDYNNFIVLGKNLLKPKYKIIKKTFERITELFNMCDDTMNHNTDPTVVGFRTHKWSSQPVCTSIH
jgi:hypothetical protein